MDQTKVSVPNCGTQDEFQHPLNQYIIGVKEHGHDVTVYSTIGTVRKGADLTLYCILDRIEAWKIRNNGRFPEKLYLQVDGGSENANQYLLTMLELLVSKRVVREIYYTRLPTGHTHEDIDACFGVIRTHLFGHHYRTLGQFRTLIESAFTAKHMKAKVKYVYVVPNYTEIFFQGFCFVHINLKNICLVV